MGSRNFWKSFGYEYKFRDSIGSNTPFGHEIVPDIPVIWVDTGYLPPETYRFAEKLTQRLKLNLQVYQSHLSPARMESLYKNETANK